MPVLSTLTRDHRQARLAEIMDEHDLAALILTSAEWFEYATHYSVSVQAWERPYAVIVPREGARAALLHELAMVRTQTALELERMWVNEIVYYTEIPRLTHRRPLLPYWAETLAELLVSHKLARSRIGVDAKTPHLERVAALLPELRLIPVARPLSRARLVKHAEELGVMREAACLSDWALARYREQLRPGKGLQELDYSIAAQTCAEAGRRFPGEDFQILRFMTLSGPSSAAAHSDGCQAGAVVKANAVAVTICNLRLNGLSMENQCTFAVGAVAPEARTLMQVALQATESGLAACIAGRPLWEVDAAAQSIVERAGYGQYLLHRTGHGIGVGTHEYPEDMAFSSRHLLPNEVLVIEPGIYVPGVGGFRYVDAAIVGEPPERLTRALKDQASMSIT
jgi:Xaa-Pro aminopeptidase